MAIAERSGVEVLDRHRRRPPLLAIGIVVAVFLVLSAVSAGGPAGLGLAAAALAAIAAGVVLHRRVWSEEQLVTADGVAIARPDGSGADIPFDRIVRVVDRGRMLRFTRDDGATLDFARTPHVRRIQSLLAERAPHVTWVEDIDPACDT